MRLLLLNYELPPLGGGAGHATYQTALMLAERGHQVDVLTSRYGGLPAHEHIGGVDIHRVHSLRRGIHRCGLSGAVTFLAGATPRLRRLMNDRRPELCHFYFSLPTGVLSYYSHALRDIPYVVSLRGSDVPAYDQTKTHMRWLHLMLGSANRRIWRRAGATVALSNSLRAQARETDPAADISVIPNGISEELFPPPTQPRPERLPLRLICVSRLVERKGLDVLLDAMSQLADDQVVLEIVGTGELEEPLRARHQALGLQERVRFVGYVGQEQLAARYHQADAFVLPSLAESFGLVLLEAMSCGLPVIATDTGGIPETITHDENGLLVPPGDADALVGAIRTMAANRELRLTMGERNVRKIHSRYTWARVAEQYERVYLDVLGGQASTEVSSRCEVSRSHRR